MEYKNAAQVLPPELIRQIREFFQGGYLYIPRDEALSASGHRTDYQTELDNRNRHIFHKHLQGWTTQQLAEHYSLSPSRIRRILQTQRKDTQTMDEQIRTLLPYWGPESGSILRRDESVWEIGGRFMLKAYDDLPTLERNARVLTVLHENGIPTAQVIPAASGDSHVAHESRFYLLTTRLEGRPYTGKITESAARSMGKTLAALHQAFQKCQNQLPLWDNSLLQELSGWILEQLEADGWEILPESVFREVCGHLAALYPRLTVQMIHRDVHFGNFLFSGDEFSGYIDFDLSQKNIRIFDLCYFLAGLLAHETGADVALPWPRIVQATVDAYDRENPLSAEEKAAMPLVMQAIELLFAAYYLSIQDRVCAEDAVRVLYRIRDELAC